MIQNFNYFTELSKYTSQLLDRLPIEHEPQSLDYSINILNNKIKSIKSNETQFLRNLWTNHSANFNTSSFAGLNTIGMLTDRFTILLIKTAEN